MSEIPEDMTAAREIERRADEEREQRRVERKETIDRLFILGYGIAIGLGIAFLLVAYGVLSCPHP